jgi:hypothetical protein
MKYKSGFHHLQYRSFFEHVGTLQVKMLGSKIFGARSVDLWPTEHISNWRLQSNEVVYFRSQTFVVLVTSQDKVASIPQIMMCA